MFPSVELNGLYLLMEMATLNLLLTALTPISYTMPILPVLACKCLQIDLCSVDAVRCVW